jgi:Glycosyltransferase family 87
MPRLRVAERGRHNERPARYSATRSRVAGFGSGSAPTDPTGVLQQLGARAHPPGLITGLPGVRLFAVVLLTVACSASFVLFGVVSFGSYVHEQLLGAVFHSDFLNYYSAGRMLLEQPYNLYLPGLEADFQRNLAGGASVYDQFWSPPQVALLYVPFALLPYGLAYLGWAVLNLGLLALSAHLLAPRVAGRSAWWLWTVLALTFLPVQQALVDGQTSFVLLCGFCAFARLRTSGHSTAPVALLAWAWKVQLVPALLLALVLDRRWRYAAGLVVAQLGVSVLVVWWAGFDVLRRYVELARTSSEQTALRISPPGQTLLGLAQSVWGVGWLAALTALVASAIVVVRVASAWRGGLRPDARRYLQLALLPVAAVLIAARAGTYELTLWLASAWLFIDYAREVPRHRALALAVVFVGWWAGDLASIAERTTGFEWGAVAGLAALGGIAWMARSGRLGQPTEDAGSRAVVAGGAGHLA